MEVLGYGYKGAKINRCVPSHKLVGNVKEEYICRCGVGFIVLDEEADLCSKYLQGKPGSLMDWGRALATASCRISLHF